MKRVWSLITVLVVLSMLASACAAPKPSRLPDPDDVKALLVQLVDVEKRAPGIVVGMIAADPQERWVVGYGRLSATDTRVPDGDTVFEIGSITKVFTGMLLAQAVLNGEVKLDDPISMYLPEGVTAPEYEGRSITLLDLATHSSGLPRDAISISQYSALDQMYAFLSGYRLTRAPGSIYEYSNFGFSLLGNLLVRIADAEDYEALLVERIFRPLGMESTGIEVTPEMRSRLALPHSTYSDIASSWNAPVFDPAGGIRSTANDMLTFLAANMGLTKTELQPAMQLANTPQRPGEGADYIGLGWNIVGSDKVHWHGGKTAGYTSVLAWDPERKIGVVVLMNVLYGPQNIGLRLIRGLPLKPVAVDPQVLAAYAGRYHLSEDIVLTIRVDGTRIFLQYPDRPEVELFASSENQFYLRVFDTEVTFYRNDSGEVNRLVFVEFGVTTEAKKVP